MPAPVGLKGEKDRRRPGERRSDIICKVKYSNTLPDVPFDPKFISYPFESDRFVRYNPTTLERNFKFDLLSEHDLGVPIDLINPETYSVNSSSWLAPEDERILEEETTLSATDSKRSRHHNKSVSWLRRTEYISTEYNRIAQKADKAESRVGFNIKKLFNVDELYKDRNSQLAVIEKTFQAVKEPVTKHHSKPGVTPVAEYPLLPDFDLWRHPFAQVIFDSDPAPNPQIGAEDMAQAMIRGMMDESGEQFVAYFLPTKDTVQKRKRDEEDGSTYDPSTQYEYLMAREYNWNVKNKASKGYEEMYFFVNRDNCVYYNELDTRVRLNKRRKVAPVGEAGPGHVPKTRLLVSHRDVNETEVNAQELRLTMLEPVPEEEEEEESKMEDNVEEDAADEPTKEKSKGSDSSAEDSDSSKSDDESEKDKNSDADNDEDDKASKSGESSSSSSSSEDESGSEGGDKEEEAIFGGSGSDSSGSDEE